MILRLFEILLIFIIIIHPKRSFGLESGAILLGGLGSVFIHESGHALTSKLLGGEVLAFDPYPRKIGYVQSDGAVREKWVLGVVASKPFEGADADTKNALVAAMGSGGNLLSVFLLAPLLPQLSSEYSKTVLDSMLFFSAFDLVAYATTDLIFRDSVNDWSRVSKLSGVSLYWYLIAGVVGGVLANEYRFYWHKKAFPNESEPNRFAFGFSTSY